MTSRGITNLVQYWMGDDGFQKYLDRLRKGAWQEESLLKILDLVDAIEVFNARCMFGRDNDKAAEALKQQGINFIVPTIQEQKEWRETVHHAVNALVKKGVVSQAMVNELHGHLNDYLNGDH